MGEQMGEGQALTVGYSEVAYDSLINDGGQYNGQRIRIAGTVGSVSPSAINPYMSIYEKGDFRLNYKACCNFADVGSDWKYGDDVEVYGVMSGTEPYADTVIPVIQVVTVKPFTVTSGIKTGYEYGPFTLYQYSTVSSGNKLFAQSDITSFKINKIGFNILSNQENKYYVDFEFSGKCTRDYCRIVVQFMDDNGNMIGEADVNASVTENEPFSTGKSVGVDMEVIEHTRTIRFASSTGDLANTPRKEDVSNGSSSLGGSTRSTSGSSNSGSSTRSSTGSSTTGSTSSRTRTGSSSYDDDPFCPTCDGLGFCPKCYGSGGSNCTCLGGKCTKCAGMGHIASLHSDRECSYCRGTGVCSKCGGSGWIECSKCHGDGLCPTCHNVNGGLKPGRSL